MKFHVQADFILIRPLVVSVYTSKVSHIRQNLFMLSLLSCMTLEMNVLTSTAQLLTSVLFVDRLHVRIKKVQKRRRGSSLRKFFRQREQRTFFQILYACAVKCIRLKQSALHFGSARMGLQSLLQSYTFVQDFCLDVWLQ